MHYPVLGLLVAASLFVADVDAQTAEPRLALVIGNSAYKVGPLANPRNDSADVGMALRSLGFEVTLRQDVNKRQMEDAIRGFGARLRKGGVGLFFYAGHAVQNREGRNFLVPIEANVASEADLGYETVDVALLLDHMEQAQNRLNIVLLDACRNNPYRSLFRSGSRGLSAVQAATGTFIAYATQPGNVAEDGEGRNSPFTKNFVGSLQHPDTDIHRVFSRVTAGVSQETGKRQVPWVSHSLTGDFYFREPGPGFAGTPAPPASAAARTDSLALELAFWEAVKESRNPEELRAYLVQYPRGQFVALARARMEALEAEPKTQIAAVKPSVPARPVLESRIEAWTTGMTFRDCPECPEMVVIPAGSFTMGSPAGEEGRDASEGPQRSVTLRSPLAVGRFEVTRGQFAKFARETGHSSSGCYVFAPSGWRLDSSLSWRNPGFPQTDDHPVTCINWQAAKDYVEWLSARTGRSYRLLTEGEWEYAARAGSITARYWGSSADQGCSYANFADQTAKVAFTRWLAANCADGHTYTAPVGSFRPNAFGLHDMLGNVLEWTEDCWNATYSGAPTDSGARLSGDCAQRVMRGGAWDSESRDTRAASRFRVSVAGRGVSNGFRIARTQ